MFSKINVIFTKQTRLVVYLFVGCFLLITLTGCEKHVIGMLNPKGLITYEERKLFFDTLALMLIVVLPVIIMSFTFIYHYQVSHQTKDYKPNWSHSFFLEALWWGIPCAIISVLAILTWIKTHELDPYQPIAGQNQPPLIVQAIALPWKWLFIYPQLDIASVNYLALPLNQQVQMSITADNVGMSAIFIPQIASQIYAMAGMRTQLHLIANQVGIYDGMNTQYNGDGFSDMHFVVEVLAAADFDAWINKAKTSTNALSDSAYQTLLQPSMRDKPVIFTHVKENLFMDVINLYMNSYGTTHPHENNVSNMVTS